MKDVIQLAVVGLGYWGPNLLRNFSATDRCVVSMCCDKDTRRFARHAPHHAETRFVTRFEEVLEAPNVDAVAIATPVNTHYPLAMAALKAGKHVLIEKPMTMRVDHAEELVAFAEKQGLVLMVDHVFVYSSPVMKFKEILESGRLGRLFFIDSVRINLGLFQSDVNVVWDLAPHDLSIIDHLVGSLPRGLSVSGSSHTDSGLEDVAYLTLDYADGLIAHVHVNWLSPVKVRSMILGGSSQSLIYNDLESSERIKVYDKGISLVTSQEQRERMMVSYRSGDIWSPNISTRETLAVMTEHFTACIREGKRPITDGNSGLRIVKLLAAAQTSIKAQGGRVAL
jgi:predicted dehydrogenase